VQSATPPPALVVREESNSSSLSKKNKKKEKLLKKYRDQDDEDRELAMSFLHGKKEKKDKSKSNMSKKLTSRDTLNLMALSQVVGLQTLNTLAPLLSEEIRPFISASFEENRLDILIVEELSKLPHPGQVRRE